MDIIGDIVALKLSRNHWKEIVKKQLTDHHHAEFCACCVLNDDRRELKLATMSDDDIMKMDPTPWSVTGRCQWCPIAIHLGTTCKMEWLTFSRSIPTIGKWDKNITKNAKAVIRLLNCALKEAKSKRNG